MTIRQVRDMRKGKVQQQARQTQQLICGQIALWEHKWEPLVLLPVSVGMCVCVCKSVCAREVKRRFINKANCFFSSFFFFDLNFLTEIAINFLTEIEIRSSECGSEKHTGSFQGTEERTRTLGKLDPLRVIARNRLSDNQGMCQHLSYDTMCSCCEI